MVTAVTQAGDGWAVVDVLTAPERAEAARCCPDCGARAAVKETVTTTPRDVYLGDRQILLRWRKRRWECQNQDCEPKTFTESVPVVPPRARLTSRLRSRLGQAVGDDLMPAAAAARRYGVSDRIAARAFTAHAGTQLADLDEQQEPVEAAGIDEFRRGAPASAADPDTGEGYKVHLSETCGEPEPDGTRPAPNLITNVATTEASVPDAAMTEPVHDMLASAGLLPGEHAVDAGYTSVLVGFPAARTYLNYSEYPSAIYVRAQTTSVSAVQSILAAAANPEAPGEVDVTQPSAALVAQEYALSAFSVLVLGLGAVALLVGAVGVANIMVISVLERRSEIGLRRALGATRGHIRVQFLAEGILLSLIGGAAGVAAGTAITAIFATREGWTITVPAEAWVGGLGAAVVIGAIAGLIPAVRAARMSPTQALWTV